MNTDRLKQIDKTQEQIQVECKSRRNYAKNWLEFYAATPWKQMYNQNEINGHVVKTLTDECPFAYSNEGDSYFVSAEMYQNLVAVCRCGRPRRGLHLLKCLQKQQNQYLTHNQQKGNEKNKDSKSSELPETSNGFVGWPRQQLQVPAYKKWEFSMKYSSPDERITSSSYNTIIIG